MAFDFSLVTAPFRMQPGLRRIAAGSAQLTPSRPGGRHLREKMAVLASWPTEALVAVPGFDALPALNAIAAEAAGDAEALAAAPAFCIDAGAGALPDAEAPHLGWSLRAGEPVGDGETAIGDVLRAVPAAQRAEALLCLAYEEDFAVVDGSQATIPWLAVCLPSRWAPAEKVGCHFAAVHAPVADNATLLAASESLARLVTGHERWERFVWTISADSRLHQHPARGVSAWPASGEDHASSPARLDAAAEALAAAAYFRSERQTFIPVPGAQQAVFTIRVDNAPLPRTVSGPETAWRLHAAIASMSPAVLAYRGLDIARDRLLHWLDRRAAAPSTG